MVRLQWSVNIFSFLDPVLLSTMISFQLTKTTAR
ncbi:hypothetical protein DSUL_140002 [Desulfovibrionales bacterium]